MAQDTKRRTHAVARFDQPAWVVSFLMWLMVSLSVNAAGRVRFVASSSAREALIAVTLNGHAMDEALPAWLDEDGRVMVQLADVVRWRIALPSEIANQRDAVTAASPHADLEALDGQAFVALDQLPGVRYRFDAAQQVLHLDVAAESFVPLVIDGRSRRFPAPAPSPPGAVLSYDLSMEAVDGDARVGGFLELTVFGSAGHVYTRFAGRSERSSKAAVRLETVWQRDRPAPLQTWSIGDDVSVAPRWSRAVRFGGIQVRKRFDLQPDLIPYPLPSFQDVAVLPSTVELLVGDALRFHRQVAPGPFTIHDPPLVEGFDQARLVVRDLLGREQVTTVPFHVEQNLLRPGLAQYALATGLVREGYGTESFAYGPWLAVGTYRRGMSDVLTLESGAEWTDQRRAGGLGLSLLRPGFGVLDSSMAVSHDDRGGWGSRFDIGFDHTRKHLSVAVRTSLADHRFGSLFGVRDGGGASLGAITEQSILRVGLAFRRQSVNVSYIRDDGPGRPVTTLVTAHASARLGARYHLLASVNALLEVGTEDDRNVQTRVALVRRIGRRTSLEVAGDHGPSDTAASVRLQRSPDGLTGLRYRLEGRVSDHESSFQGSASGHMVHVGWRADVAGSGDTQAFRFGLAGSAVTFGKGVSFSRRIVDSFARVELPGMPGVRVYANNRLVGRTNARGYALVPNLSSYYPHTIRVEPKDLPAHVDAAAVDTIATAYRRSGLRLTLPIRRVRGALVTIITADGSHVPVGAKVQDAVGVETPVGFEGQVYLTGLEGTQSFLAQWPTGRCRFSVAMPADAGPVPSIGPVRCMQEETP